MVVCGVGSPSGWRVVDGIVDGLGSKLDTLYPILLICDLSMPYIPKNLSEVYMTGRCQ